MNLLVIGSALALAPMSAHAGLVDIGGGWEALWDNSLDDFVDVIGTDVTTDAVFIQKSAEFTQGPQNGIFPTIAITFRQTSADAVSNIVIDDEIITNSTGIAWLDFHMVLLNGNDAVFDDVATATSGGPGPIGFSISPFTQAAFTSDRKRLDISGGIVPDGGVWFPGSGVSDGQLWISVSPKENEPFTVFTLKEAPTVPAPSTVCLLAIGAMSLLGRRRHVKTKS